MKVRSRFAAAGAALALGAAAFGIAMTPAGAAGSFSSALTGSLNLNTGSGSSTLDVSSGSMISGSFDPDAGTLTGNVSLGNTSFPAETAVGDAIVAISFTSGGAIQNGVVDGTNVSFDDVQTVNLDSATVGGTAIPLAPCFVGPVTLHYTGTYNPDTGAVQVTSNTATVPALEGTCNADAIKGMIAPMLEGATVQASANFNIGTADEPGPDDTTPDTTTPDTTPGSTVPGQPVTTFTDVVSNGCVITATIDFAEPGDYTLTVTTNDDREIGSVSFTRDEAGTADIDVTVDADHGTAHGDELNLTLTDADGNVVAQNLGEVDDPDACAPSPTTTSGGSAPLVQSNSAPAATAASAQPAYTG